VGASTRGVDGAVRDRGRPYAGASIDAGGGSRAEASGDLSISLTTAIRDVADFTAASCSVVWSSVCWSYGDTTSVLGSSLKGSGRRCPL
jgi:hypothetical protein